MSYLGTGSRLWYTSAVGPVSSSYTALPSSHWVVTHLLSARYTVVALFLAFRSVRLAGDTKWVTSAMCTPT